MGVVKLRVWCCLFFGIAIVIASTVTAARNTISLSSPGKAEVVVVATEVVQAHQVVHGGGGGGGGGGRRSLIVSLDDYSPSANHGHDPPKSRGGSSKP